ncbi:MAG TPA: hypothetical protein VEB22_04145 [Phycisphaerales bacterium]|nr:hypothetical protein [Phycisphaerales bacterium]
MRLRDPIPAGRSKRIGAAAVGSMVLHAAVAAALTGAALSIAADTPATKASADIQMTVHAAASNDLFRAAPQAATPELNAILAKAGSGGGPAPAVQTDTGGNGNLAEVLAEADSIAVTSGAATTSASGAAAALEHTPAGAGVAFAGLTARGEQARTVVYAIDASGPMISSLNEVFAEVNRSVAALLPTQRFGVVLFRDDGDGPGTVVFDSALREANPRNREQLQRWLASVTASGRSNPMDGLRAALALKPQVVFLLSRSINRTGGGVWDVGPKVILDELERLNPPVSAADPRSRATLIKTIQFQEPDSTGVMQQIAERHGSRSSDGPAYRVLKREELQKR